MDDDDDDGASQLPSPYNRGVYQDHTLFASSIARVADHPFSFPILSSFPVEATGKSAFALGELADALRKLSVSAKKDVLHAALQVTLPTPAEGTF